MTEIQAVMTRVTRTEMVGEHLVRVSVAGDELWTLPWGESGPGPRARHPPRSRRCLPDSAPGANRRNRCHARTTAHPP